VSNNSGITSLYPPVIDDEEVRLQAQAKADVMRRLNVSSTPLPAAPKPIMDSESLGSIYKPAVLAKTKDELHKEYMEKEYGDKTIEAGIRGKIQKNKRLGRAPYEGFATHDMIIAENMSDRAKRQIKAAAGKTDKIMEQVKKYSPNKIMDLNSQPKNKKNFAKPVSKNSNGLDGRMMVDPKHPDGFRFTHVNDLYRQYGDDPERYIQEVLYLYEGGAVPTAGVVKQYDSLDSSTYPSAQLAPLKKYESAVNKLNPQQKKIVENNMRNKSAVGKRTLTKREPEKLFENIFDKNGLRVNKK
tara:strand:- start:2330 stop:3226 length:897 start_codon:yes stop_codon:yes gene_type:complete